MFSAKSLIINNLINNGEVVTNITDCKLWTRKETNDNRGISTGGIVGYITRSTLMGMENTKKITVNIKNSETNSVNCGGSVGVCYSSTIENAHNYGEIYTASDSDSNCGYMAIGGVVGGIWHRNDGDAPLVTKCSNKAKVTGEIICNNGKFAGRNWRNLWYELGLFRMERYWKNKSVL